MTPALARLAAPKRLRAALSGLGALLALIVAVPALADLVDAYFPPGIIGPADRLGVTVNSRERRATDPLGVHVGAFTVRPNISVGAGYDSNPLFLRRPRPGAVIVTSGAVAATSNWSTDNLSGLITFEDTRYPTERGQSTTNWSASLGKVFNFGTDRLALTATHLAQHQTARDLNAPALDSPGAYAINNARITYTTERGPFTLTPQLQYTGYRYDDVSIAGVRSSQRYRDRDIVDGQLTAKLGYALLRDVAVVLRGASIQYVAARPGQIKPDATVVALLAGLDHATSAVWRYRVLAGVQARQSSSPQVKTKSAPVIEANLIYMPSGLTTIGLTATRAVQDAAGEFAAAFTYTAASISIDHELYRDILLHAHAGIQRAEYDQSRTSETLVNAQAAVTWLLNRNAQVTGSYTYLAKQPARGGAITESLAMVRLQLGL